MVCNTRSAPEQYDLNELKLYLDSIKELRAAYLFGSRAEGLANRSSDWDFGVLFWPGLSDEASFNLQMEIAGKLSLLLRTDLIDVVCLNLIKSLELKYAVVQDGICIVDRDPDLFEYEMKIRHEYEDHISALKRNGYLGLWSESKI